MRLKALFIIGLILLPSCTTTLWSMDPRGYSDRTITVQDGTLLAKYEDVSPSPILVDQNWKAIYENPEKKIKFEVTVGTQGEKAGKVYDSMFGAFIGFFVGLFAGGG